MSRQVRKVRRPSWRKFQPTTSIIVPVMNESANVLPLVQRIQSTLKGHLTEVLFVDDSLDQLTVWAVMAARVAYCSNEFTVDIFHRKGDERWGGLSGAVTDGMQRAKSDQIIVMDGDLQHPPETIPAMIEAAQSNDLVMASRYRKDGSAGGLDNGLRHLVSRGSTLLAKLFFPWRLQSVTDPMTGFFLLNRGKLTVDRLHPKGFKILLEILATHPELTVDEVPLQFAERTAGESHGSFKQGLEFFSQLLHLRFGRLRLAHTFAQAFVSLPKAMQFGAIGGSVFVAGMAMLYGMVEILGFSPLLANAVQLAVTFWLNYSLNKNITWKERAVSRLAMHKFLVSRAATTTLNYLLFALLVSLQFSFQAFGQAVGFSINYLAANVITLLAIMAINYEVSDRWAFAEQTAEPKQSARKFASARLHLSGLSVKGGRLRGLPGGAYWALIVATILIIGIKLNPALLFAGLLATAGLGLFLQSSIEVWRMMYVFRQPDSVDQLRFPDSAEPRERFALIVPARHESAVLASTLGQLAQQTHPNVSIISVICDDDYDTLKVAYEAATDEPRISVMQYPLAPGVKPSKPKQLNYVFTQIKRQGYTVIGVVDAEDNVHPELLLRIDSAFRDKNTGIVQGGVQLMNHDSSWYSLHNVLEYYRWFNSAMAFQSDSNFMPLGGNTVFVRTSLLRKAGGWPETLTEDCSLGVLISSRFTGRGTKTAVYYEPELATREETPDSLQALFKQRVRWNQGFFHEYRKGVWRELPGFRQRLLAGYTLLSPVLLASINVLMVGSLISALLLSAPVSLVMLMYLPLIPAALLVVLNAMFLHDFGKAFLGRKVTLRHYLVLFTTHIAYQIVLNAAAFWAIVRELRGDQSWYKTAHSGQHRWQAAFATGSAHEDAGVPDA